MHEIEKETAEIDMLAAGVNRDAAAIVSLAEGRARSARTRQGFARFPASWGDEPTPPAEKLVGLEHEESLAELMAAEAEKVRVSAAELQRLAREMRGHLAADRV